MKKVISFEKRFSYKELSIEEAVKHFAGFTSDIWQIHPFCEGNTRATAVFMIKYITSLGFRIHGNVFEKDSWYFRNALVRASNNHLPKGIYSTNQCLEMFFCNLLLGTNCELKNRVMHVHYVAENATQKAT